VFLVTPPLSHIEVPWRNFEEILFKVYNDYPVIAHQSIDPFDQPRGVSSMPFLLHIHRTLGRWLSISE
jgi:hypothetical protein